MPYLCNGCVIMSAKPSPKILMSRKITGAHQDLNEHRHIRYNQRQRSAEELELNFRKCGRLIMRHGIRRFLESNHYRTGAHGLCAVCGKEAQICICQIEVKDHTGQVIQLL